MSYYARHLALKGFDNAEQKKLTDSKILVVGCGGLGNLTAMYLCTAGVGQLLINDFDTVDESNLQRQILFSHSDIGNSKAHIAKQKLSVLNPDCKIEAIDKRLNLDELNEACAGVDLIIDCTDNFASRYNINQVSQALKIPLLTGAAIRFQGQLSFFNPNETDSPCYQCVYPEQDESLENCEGNGILAPVTGVIASHMAVEAIKFLSQIGTTLSKRLLLYDAKYSNWREIKIRKRTDCPICTDN